VKKEYTEIQASLIRALAEKWHIDLPSVSTEELVQWIQDGLEEMNENDNR